MEDNDPAGYKSSKAMAAQSKAGTATLDLVKRCPDLSPLIFSAWAAVNKKEGLPESSTVGAAPKVATKKMPKPSEPAPRRKVQKIVRYDDSHERDVPLQLQPGAQAYIGPEHILKVPVRPMNERLVEISHCLSNHLREPGLWSLGKRQCL